MSFFVERTEEGQNAYKTFLVEDPRMITILGNEIALKILKELGKKPACPMDIARNLKDELDVSEQTIYYNIKKLEAAGLVRVITTEQRSGAVAKIYEPVASVISIKLFPSEPIKDLKVRSAEIDFLRPFINEGAFDSLIILGSPDPHGKYRSRASDGFCAINLAMFFGQFTRDYKIPFYKLDTQVREVDLEKNLVIVGGPKANIVSAKINEHLPIFFDYSEELREWSIVSSLSKKIYREKQVGLIARIDSPFKEGREILLFAGMGFRGTRAAVLGFIRHLDQIQDGNSFNPKVIAKVVRGVDIDADGIIDDVEFLE